MSISSSPEIVFRFCALGVVCLATIWFAFSAYSTLKTESQDAAAVKAARQAQQQLEVSEKRLSKKQEDAGIKQLRTQELLQEEGEDIATLEHNLKSYRHRTDLDSQRVLESRLQAIQREIELGAPENEVSDLSERVSSLSADLQATQGEIAQNKSELNRLAGTTQEQLLAVRDIGKRNIYEFEIRGKGSSENVANIKLDLIEAKPDTGQFSISVDFEGRPIQKMGWYLNEPIYLHSPGVSSPIEVLVNQVKDDDIAGYVSVPAEMVAGHP